MSKHTPEPWIISPGACQNCLVTEDAVIAHFVSIGERGWETAIANAHRAWACVNACKGIDPAAVPDLLAALKAAVAAGMVPQLDSLPTNTKTAVGDAAKMIYAAIAKAEGGAQ